MQSVQIVTFVLKEIDQQVRKYNKVHQAHSLKSFLTFQGLCLVDQLVKKFPLSSCQKCEDVSCQKFQEISCQKFPVSSFQLVKKFPAFHSTQRFFLPHSQECTIVPHPEPQKCSSHLHNLIYKIHFNIILQSVSNFPQVVSPLAISHLLFL